MTEPTERTIWVVEYFYPNGTRFTSPLLEPNDLRAMVSAQETAQQFMRSIDRSYLQLGRFAEALQHLPELDIKSKTLTITVKDPPDPLLFETLQLPFTYFYARTSPGTYIGFIPVIGAKTYGRTLEELESNAEISILSEFARKKRFSSLRSIVGTQLQNSITVAPVRAAFSLYSRAELRYLSEESETRSRKLPVFASPPKPSKLRTYGLEPEVEVLARALRGRSRQSALIIGPPGSGKSALFYEVWRQRKALRINSPFWETTASRMLQKLTGRDSWQAQLADACHELRNSGGILYLHSLRDLFEVGQYLGNNVSMGQFLRSYIARGDILVVSECTAEEADKLEVLYPGVLAPFQRITLPAPVGERLHAVVDKAVSERAGDQQVAIAHDAIDEAVRLGIRYTPYSGFPGKTIRFFEDLLRARKDRLTLTAKDVLEFFCEQTGMPAALLDPEAALDVRLLEQFFASRVLGQPEAVSTIVDLLLSVKTQLTRTGKPIASLLFAGPTGVGKTEMVKVLAEWLFGRRTKIVRFDMSEFSDLGSVLRLTGDIGKGDGSLISAVRKEPFSVVLFDELEKAHPAFFDLLLQILGEGRLMDGRGSVADFCSTVVIMTSNLGADAFRAGTMGFGDSGDERRRAVEFFLSRVRSFFRPELFNRLDGVIAFSPLSEEVIRSIVEKELSRLFDRPGLQARDLELHLDPSVRDHLSKMGFSVEYGARQLQRILQDRLVVPLARGLNRHPYNASLSVKCLEEDGKLTVTIKPRRSLPLLEQKAEGVVSWSAVAAEASQLRREVQRVLDGAGMMMALSTLDVLESRLRKVGVKALDRKFMETDASEWRKVTVDIQSVHEHACQYEEEVCSALLMGKIPASRIEQTCAALQASFIKAEIGLYRKLAIRPDVCTIGIYGDFRTVVALADIYMKIGSRWGMTIAMREMVSKGETPERVAVKLSNWRAVPSDAKLLGIELEFQGSLAHLRFSGEGGIHSWRSKRGTSKCLVVVDNIKMAKFEPPATAHRLQGLRNVPERRHYSETAGIITDKGPVFVAIGDFEKNLGDALERSFVAKLAAALIEARWGRG